VNAWNLLVAVDDWFHSHRRLVGAISIAAFALFCAQYAGFIALPKLLEIPARFAWAFPALKYGVWDAFVSPRLSERRQDLGAG
jgi:hypothetical protein